jgi:hypothetical protein
MERVKQILKELNEYFNVQIAGSYQLAESGLLPMNFVNDIDLLVNTIKVDAVLKYFNNNGYTVLSRYKSYELEKVISEYSLKKKNNYSFHLLVVNDTKQASIHEILCYKLKRLNQRDITHLRLVLKAKEKKLRENELKEDKNEEN